MLAAGGWFSCSRAAPGALNALLWPLFFCSDGFSPVGNRALSTSQRYLTAKADPQNSHFWVISAWNLEFCSIFPHNSISRSETFKNHLKDSLSFPWNIKVTLYYLQRMSQYDYTTAWQFPCGYLHCSKFVLVTLQQGKVLDHKHTHFLGGVRIVKCWVKRYFKFKYAQIIPGWL